MQTIFLTGATGFLGSHLLAAFITHGYKVIIAIREHSDLWRIHDLISHVKLYQLNEISIEKIFDDNRIDGIIHTACNYGRGDVSVSETVASNVIFGIKILETAVKNKVKFFINTDTLLPQNVNVYSLSKNQFTAWLRLFSSQINIINLKIEHMYGAKDDSNKFIYWFINQAINSEKTINLTSGIQKRDFIYIDDVVNAYLLILSKWTELGKWAEFDIGTGKFLSVKEFLEQISYAIFAIKKIEIQNKLNFGAVPYRENDIMIPEMDNSKLLALGWIPHVSVAEGVKKIIESL